MVKNLPAMQETWGRSLGQEDLVEKGIAILSSILAWRIPQIEKPGWLQFVGSERVRHDWVTNTFSKHRLVNSRGKKKDNPWCVSEHRSGTVVVIHPPQVFPTCSLPLVLEKWNEGQGGDSGSQPSVSSSGAWEGTGGVFLLEKTAGKVRLPFQYLKAAFLKDWFTFIKSYRNQGLLW